jgi:hypothetical protein
MTKTIDCPLEAAEGRFSGHQGGFGKTRESHQLLVYIRSCFVKIGGCLLKGWPRTAIANGELRRILSINGRKYLRL